MGASDRSEAQMRAREVRHLFSRSFQCEAFFHSFSQLSGGILTIISGF